ncbi:DMT family transporter [Deinococcus sp.]|uniref:DMT family transporter n=1 Tax=Deinococcus sp. TaxID=47478 RepID=UPI003C7AE474
MTETNLTGAGRSRSGALAQMLLIAATWGTAVLFIKLAVSHGLPPLILATLRAGLAGLTIGAWLLVSGAGIRLPPLRVALLLGLLNGFLPNVLLAYALSRIDSAPAALLQATTPLFVAALGQLGLSADRIVPRQALGMLAALGGLLLLIGPAAVLGGSATVLGSLAVLGAAMSYAGAALAVSRLRLAEPTQAAFGQQLAAVTFAAVAAALLEPPSAWQHSVWQQPAGVCWALLGMAVVRAAIPVILFFRLLRSTPPAQAALVHYLLPVAALIYGVGFLGERLYPLALLGGVVVLASVWVANSAQAAARRTAQARG